MSRDHRQQRTGENDFQKLRIFQASTPTGFCPASFCPVLREMTLARPALLCLAPLSHETPFLDFMPAVSGHWAVWCWQVPQSASWFISAVAWKNSELPDPTYICGSRKRSALRLVRRRCGTEGTSLTRSYRGRSAHVWRLYFLCVLFNCSHANCVQTYNLTAYSQNVLLWGLMWWRCRHACLSIWLRKHHRFQCIVKLFYELNFSYVSSVVSVINEQSSTDSVA